jgi:hypothetical protein
LFTAALYKIIQTVTLIKTKPIKKMIYISDTDPAMRYEALARYAFGKCPKGGDPFHYSMQEVYNHNFVGEITIRGRRALSTVLIKLVLDNQNSQKEEGIKKLEDRVWEADSQKEIIDIIDQAIELINKSN